MAKDGPGAGGRLPVRLVGVGVLLAAAAGAGLVTAGQEPAGGRPGLKELPKVVTDNKNTLVKDRRAKLKVTASSFWRGWEPDKVIDGDVETSWFTERGDAAAKGTKPWVAVTFPEDVTVT